MTEISLNLADTGAPVVPVALSRRQKAAIIVQLMLSRGEQLPLGRLTDEHQAKLTEVMGRMRAVDRATLRAVVEEFVAEIDEIGLSFPGGIDGALDVLDGQISAATASRLRRQALSQGAGDPWIRIEAMDNAQLLAAIQSEAFEVGAVILSKLPTARAAELLGMLPGERARRLAHAIAETSRISPENVRRIGLALVQDIETRPRPAFEVSPVERVGAILNYARAAIRDEVLEGLEQEDAEFAAAVKKAIFTFNDIPDRIDPRDIPKLVKECDGKVLTTALAAAMAAGEAGEAAAEFLLANMSQRMASQLRDDAGDLGTVKDEDGEEAMGQVIATLREMEGRGEITMLTPAQ